MSYLLQFLGCLWIFLTFKTVLAFFRRFLSQGMALAWNYGDLLTLLLLIGGVGLLLLRHWGRWLVLAGCAGMIWLKAGGALSHLQFNEPVIRVLLFYGIFIVLMLLPQARRTTR